MAATGLRINRPSDDPADYRTVLFRKDSLNQTQRFLRSVDVARPRFQAVEAALADAAEIVLDAKIVATAGSNSSNFDDPGARVALRLQVEQAFDQLLAASNVRSPSGDYVFSGTASDTASFVSSGAFVSGSPPPTVTFMGENSNLEVEIDEDVFVEVTRGGAGVFQGPVDVFGALGRLWSALDSGAIGDVQLALGELDQAREHLVGERAAIGGAEQNANRTEQRLLVREEQTRSQISLLEDADVFEVYSDLVTQESALQASLEVTSRLLQPTLLDFI